MPKMELPKTKYELSKKVDEPRVKEPASAQDIFPVCAVSEDGIFALPNGRYSREYLLSDINFSGVTDEEQKEIIINFSHVLKAMSCRFSYTMANEYVDEREFRKKILYRMNRDEFDNLRKSYNEEILDKVQSAKQGLFQSIFLTLTVEADSMEDALSAFGSLEGAIRSAFTGIGIDGMQGVIMTPVKVDSRIEQLISFFRAGLPVFKRFSFEEEFAEGRDFINDIAPETISFFADHFIMNGSYGKVYFADVLPHSLESDILSILRKEINCTSYIAVNNELLELSGFKQEVNRKYAALGMKIENEKQRNRNNNDYLADASAKLLSEKEKLDDFNASIDSDDEHYYNTTLLVMVLADSEDELSAICKKLESNASLRSLGLAPCFGKQKEGLISALPFGAQEFKKVTNLSSSCLAMLIPFKTQELNDKNGIYYGINQLSQNVILADKKKLMNHNGLILGKSGSGKSMLAKSEIISMFLTNPTDQFMIVDPQAEYGSLTRKVGGTIISFDSAKEFFLNPLDVDFEGMDYSGVRQIISEKSDFILTLLENCMRRDLTPEEQGLVDAVIERVYSENYSMRKRLNGYSDEQSEFSVPGYLRSGVEAELEVTELSNEEQIRAYSPTLQDVYQGLSDDGSAMGKRLAASMEIFVNGSLNLFNHRTNIDLSKRFLVFDISHLKDNLRVTSMLIMMETVREKIRSNAKKGQWTHLYIDEFHELLRVPQVADFVLKLWKEIRKMSGILNGITQNMSDLLTEENGSQLQAILSNTEYFALLSQSTNDKRALMNFLPQISPAMFTFVDNAESGTGLLKMGSVCVPFDMRMKKSSPIYQLIQTDGGLSGGTI